MPCSLLSARSPGKAWGPVILVMVLLAACVGGIVWLSNRPMRTQYVFRHRPGQTLPKEAQGQPKLFQSMSPEKNPYLWLDLLPTGKLAPNFTASTADGGTLTLKTLLGKKQWVIVSFVSDTRCAPCEQQLLILQHHLPLFKQAHAQVVAVATENRQDAMQRLVRLKLTFPLLSDPNLAIAKLYQVIPVNADNPQAPATPWMVTYVIDPNGVVQKSFADPTLSPVQADALLTHVLQY